MRDAVYEDRYRRMPGYQVEIFDTTLRDGEQSPGISLNVDEKLQIAHQLGRLGVDVIEAGFPIASPGDFEAVQKIAQEVQGPVICGLARANSMDIDRAYEAIKDAERPRIHTFVSTSDIHIEHQMRNTRDDVRGLAKASVAQARALTDEVQFSPMDATRSDPEFTAEIIQIALDEGATIINIPDTVGYATPDEYTEFINEMHRMVPHLGRVVTSVHCHQDLGLAVANSYAGLMAGARQVEGAINGIGERAGNTALEEIIMLIDTRGDRHGLYTGINLSEIARTSRLVSRLTGYSVPRNKAVVGQNAFAHESGIHQDGVIKERTTFEIMDPTALGFGNNNIVLGKHSGRRALREVLEEQNAFNPDMLVKVFKRFKDVADQIGEITPAVAVALAEDVERRVDSPYKVVRAGVSTLSSKHKSAAVRIINPDGEKINAEVSEDSNSDKFDGPIDALFAALKEATGTDYKVENYHVDALGAGQKTVADATVELRYNGHTVKGFGLDTDTAVASAWAYVDALSKVPRKV